MLVVKCCLLQLLSVLLAGVLLGESTESREWVAKSGHKVVAKALALADNKVQFERTDGSKITVDLDKLSDGDQTMLRDHFGIKEPEPGAGPAVETADDLPHPLGKTTDEIQADGGWSYFLYLPETLPKGEKHPVMFIMDPGGGSARTANRYIPGANRNRFIIAVSKQSKNGFGESAQAIEGMMRHVRETLPVDEDRLYTSGFSGGSRMALSTAAKNTDIAGVLACGAGGNVGSAKQLVYGLCGSNCFNRTDMANSFKGYGNRDGILRYFPGKHDWAKEDLIDDAMTHLNGVFLFKNAKKYPEVTERYVHDVMTLIRENQESDPLRAYVWAEFLTEHDANSPDLASIHGKLAQSETNKLFLKGLTDIDDFAVKSFGDISNSQWQADPKVSAACLREAKKYTGTPWEEVLTKMAEDAQKF